MPQVNQQELPAISQQSNRAENPKAPVQSSIQKTQTTPLKIMNQL